MVQSCPALRRLPPLFRVLAVTATLAMAGFVGQAQAADPLKGAKLYNERCSDCHGTQGVPTMPGVPDFTRSQALMQTDLDLVKTISVGKGMMPAFQGRLSEREILDVIAYLRTLQ